MSFTMSNVGVEQIEDFGIATAPCPPIDFDRIPRASDRLAIAMFHRALADRWRPDSKVTLTERRSAKQFFTDERYEPVFQRLGMRQEYFPSLECRHESESEDIVQAILDLTAYDEFALYIDGDIDRLMRGESVGKPVCY